MITVEKYYDDGEEASRAIIATSDSLDFRIGIMYDTDTGDSCIVTIRGREEFRKFAASLISVLSEMSEENTPI